MYARNSARSILKFWCNEKILGMDCQLARVMADVLKGALDGELQGCGFAFEDRA
jgi:hypothetical protein